jgi:hypothetical protein
LLATPDDVKVAEGVQSYTATYKLHGDTLTVRRVFEDHTAGVVCSSAAIRAQKAFARKVVQDQRAQIVYK